MPLVVKLKHAILRRCLNVARAKKQGLPVDDFVTTDWKEGSGISAGGGTISLMNQAPHPNAAKLLINWFLSSKGQLARAAENDIEEAWNFIAQDTAAKETFRHRFASAFLLLLTRKNFNCL